MCFSELIMSDVVGGLSWADNLQHSNLEYERDYDDARESRLELHEVDDDGTLVIIVVVVLCLVVFNFIFW